MDDLRGLFKKSGLTFHELSKLSGVSLSTVHRYVNHKTKDMDQEHYSSIYDILKEYEEYEMAQDYNELDCMVILAERAMYKAFYDYFVEIYKHQKNEN